MKLARVLPLLACAATVANASHFLEETSGIISYALAGAIVVASIIAIQATIALVASALGRRRPSDGFSHLALVTGAVMFSFVLVEAGLQVVARFHGSGEGFDSANSLVMPSEWRRRVVRVDGAVSAYYWHGHLHIHNRDNMRLVGEFQEKIPGSFRVIALGDSLTYGYGIAEEDAYPRVLERELSRRYRVEVLNLGVPGAQSEDISTILQKQLSLLRPDLVFYGVCLNDFLASNVGEYQSNRAYAIRVPYGDHFIKKTLMGNLLATQYDSLLMRLGLRHDFVQDILKDFDGYQTRFAKDVNAMNAFVREHGLPPIVAMVLDQYPDTKGKRYQVALAADKHLRAAGVHVIPPDYIPRNNGAKDWHVSRWEGHPNERAHRVFAQEIIRVVGDLRELQPYLWSREETDRRSQ